jgi:hypothetical protein
MWIAEFLIALIVAAILAVLLTAAVGRRGPGPLAGFLFFFVLLFVATWAGGLWITPYGPLMWGTVPWLSYVVVGVIIALLLAALIPPVSEPVSAAPPAPGEEIEATTTEKAAAGVGVALGIFFWLFLLAMIIAIAARYVVLAAD